MTNPWKRLVARRRKKAHEGVEAERARQKLLAGQDTEEAVKNLAYGSRASAAGIMQP